MTNFDSETWIYIALIAIALLYFFWNSSKARKNRKERKNRNFRRRYIERKREKEKGVSDF
ncbi:hypothetical protein FHG64_14595 [Antarcticibacterium flavum]|uniref:Uncharacterized protein n=1 Tax=Antarcticibacterium flavum TaxID=2058175 RepID=A0A5B7X599_9FLAO|nr:MULTISPECIES: hypothetical protein [Antarcticibacterium]MCM4161040.1 hypothetical protein [Antarcticibacterium sp. W02-3]QCY70529.1 hypothetical protein FHG64_14595 [Antarcticibacterium flavum]